MLNKILLTILLGKGGDDMMAMLYVTQILAGKKTYAQVPPKLKGQVRDLLIDCGCEDLITE